MYELCHRCHGVLPQHAPSSGRGAYSGLEPDALLFCPHCSAPQILLPEHMRPLTPEASVADTTGLLPPPDPTAIDWPVALRCAAAVALIGAALTMVGDFFGFFSFLGGLWVLGGSMLTLTQYRRSKPRGRMDLRTGMRIGTVAAVLMVASVGFSSAVLGVVERFATHRLDQQDVDMAQQSKRMEAQIEGWLKTQGATAEEQKRWDATGPSLMNSPEIRAGGTLAADAVLAGFLVLLGAGLGATSGALGARRQGLVQNR